VVYSEVQHPVVLARGGFYFSICSCWDDYKVRAIEGAHNEFLDLEELSEEDLARVRGHFEALARVSREDLKRGLMDTRTAELPTD
jgi:hypothetical protein